MSDQALPEAVERVLQQFEAMAPAADWVVGGQWGVLRTQVGPDCPEACCPLAWMAFGRWHPSRDSLPPSAKALGLTLDQAKKIAWAADGDQGPIRARLLAAAGLA